MNKVIFRRLEISSAENISPAWKKIVWYYKEKRSVA